MIIDYVVKFFNLIPHYNFKFSKITARFDLSFKSEYIQSLILLSAVCGVFLFLLMCTIATIWVCQCCRRHDASVKSRRKVKRLSTALFVLSVICFFALGFTLFANDHINRGITASLSGIDDVYRSFTLARSQGAALNSTCLNSTQHIKDLSDVVSQKSEEMKVNKTVCFPSLTTTPQLVAEIDDALKNMSSVIDDVMGHLRKFDVIVIDISFLQQAHEYGERIEIERWLLFVIVQSVQLCVLFAGVISFCRQSKKGAVIFSALGIVIFVVVWVLTAFVFPASVGLSDFCQRGATFIKSKLNDQLIGTLEYYKTCSAVPPSLHIKEIGVALNDVQVFKSKLDSMLDAAFNHSAEVSKVSAVVSKDNSASLVGFGALQSSLGCYAYKIDVNSMHTGLCSQAFFGAALLLFTLLFLGLMLFILLIVVSRTWHLYTRLPSDYVEVDEDDPFFPRTNESAIPVDIYGTHVFNPRTRERTDPSTGTTSANTNAGGDDAAQPLWRGPTAPPSNGTYPRTVLDDYSNYNERYG